MGKIVIIGGGAAGLMAAVSAAEADTKNEITVIEKNSRPARKLMITGKGRCNVTNNCDNNTVMSNIPRNSKFLYSALSDFSTSDTVSFFETHGVPLKTERGNRVFPVSDKASDIVDALVRTVLNSGVRIVNGEASNIVLKDGSVREVVLKDGRTFECDSLLIATGGVSYPMTGSTGDGYIFAKKVGHTVTDIKPSLIPLCCHEGFCSKLSGLTLKNVILSLYEKGKKKPLFSEIGELLFTHFGISGPLALSASAYLSDMGEKEYFCSVDLKPGLSAEQLDARILRDFSENPNKIFLNSLDRLLPKSLIPVVVSLSGIGRETKVNSITKAQRADLVYLLKNFTLNITGTRPVEEAIITRGGVSVKEVDPKTMQSKIVKGLFFAGEVLDVDGFTGGFNLQIAFSTGHLAGKNM